MEALVNEGRWSKVVTPLYRFRAICRLPPRWQHGGRSLSRSPRRNPSYASAANRSLYR